MAETTTKPPVKPAPPAALPHPSLHERAHDEVQHQGDEQNGKIDKSTQVDPLPLSAQFPGIDVRERPEADTTFTVGKDFITVGGVSVARSDVKRVVKRPDGGRTVTTSISSVEIAKDDAETLDDALGL